MATMQLSDKAKTIDVVKRAYYLAWKECGGTFGMGAFQDRGPDVSEDQVWNGVVGRVDYPGGNAFGDGFNTRDGVSKVYADYVFGRMMKLSVTFTIDTGAIEVDDSKPRRDYQGWSGRKYPTYIALFEAAAKELSAEIAHAETAKAS